MTIVYCILSRVFEPVKYVLCLQQAVKTTICSDRTSSHASMSLFRYLLSSSKDEIVLTACLFTLIKSKCKTKPYELNYELR